MKKSIIAFIIITILLSLSVFSEKATANNMKNKNNFSVSVAISAIRSIADALDSFSVLTDKFKKNITEKDKTNIGNLDWEIQNIGFINWCNSIEGTILKQNLKIKSLELELAIKNNTSQKDIENKKLKLKKAKKDFKDFYDNFIVVD